MFISLISKASSSDMRRDRVRPLSGQKQWRFTPLKIMRSPLR